MPKAFRQGMLIGLLAPFAFAAGVVAWIYRYTGRVPFPTRRTEEGELVVALVAPAEVRGYWAYWREELAPILAGAQDLWERLRAQCTARPAPDEAPRD